MATFFQIVIQKTASQDLSTIGLEGCLPASGFKRSFLRLVLVFDYLFSSSLNQFIECQSTLLILIGHTHHESHISLFQLLHLIAASTFLLHSLEQFQFFLLSQ